MLYILVNVHHLMQNKNIYVFCEQQADLIVNFAKHSLVL